MADAHWSEPEKVIEQELAKSLVAIADLFAKEETVTVKEIELWIKHMRPVYGAPLDWMKTALLNWYAEMREDGLWEEGVVSVVTFLRGQQKEGQALTAMEPPRWPNDAPPSRTPRG